MAWNVLTLIARWRVCQRVLYSMYGLGIVGAPSYGAGKGLAADFLLLMGDFFNGAYGDAPLPAEDFFGIVAGTFVFLPQNLRMSEFLFDLNLQGKLAH